MIDGVKCSCFGLDAKLWQNNPLLDFGLSVSESTGELLTQRREAKAKDLRFILSPTNGGGLSCSFAGSLHKYKNIDGNNHNDFTFSELFNALDSLALDYNIDLNNTYIHGIEIGVNIELDYSPEIVFKKAVCHKGKPFEKINPKDKRIGVICSYTDYSIKLYDKGYQCKIDGKSILRFEIKLFRQRPLQPFDISTLADLKDVEKVTPLISLLLERLNEIIFFDYSFKPKGFTRTKLLSWQQYGNPRYWESLNRNSYYKARKKLVELTQKYNCIDWGQFVSKRVTKKWFELAEIKQKNRRHFPHILKRLKAQKRATFSNLECMSENVTLGTLQKRKEKESKKEPCYCISCGRQLTGQKQGSRFCSERIFGKEARRCRNKDSNKKLAIKRKIYRAMEKDLMLRITYEVEGKEYSDILGANEINVTREWLEKVKSVERLEPQQSTLTEKEAKDYLQTISKSNENE